MANDLNCREAAAVLGLSIGTVRLHADQGKLAHRRTAGGHRRFTATDLEAYRSLREVGERPRATERADVWAVAVERLIRTAEADLGSSSPLAAPFAEARGVLRRARRA